jgi:hypothetical protein
MEKRIGWRPLSSTRPAMAATAASVPARARAASEATASERELGSEGTRE